MNILYKKIERPRESRIAAYHRHYGFETVTYMLEVWFAHKDSSGNSDKSGPGDVFWVTARADVIYYFEMPDKERIYSCGGLLYSCISVMG